MTDVEAEARLACEADGWQMMDATISFGEVSAAVEALAPGKAPGADGLTSELLVRGGASVPAALTLLFAVVDRYECTPRRPSGKRA